MPFWDSPVARTGCKVRFSLAQEQASGIFPESPRETNMQSTSVLVRENFPYGLPFPRERETIPRERGKSVFSRGRARRVRGQLGACAPTRREKGCNASFPPAQPKAKPLCNLADPTSYVQLNTFTAQDPPGTKKK